MDLIVVGLNHKTAPIEIREKLAFPGEGIGRALCQAKCLLSLKENMILSTCNRVEIYAATPEPESALIDLKTFLSEYHHISVDQFEQSLYVLTGEEAVRHIFRVASSLDSMVVGEPQILGQIKSAYEMATEAKSSGFILHRLLHQAFHVAKRVRTETKIANSAVSISFVAVELAKKIFGTLEKKVVLLIGAGEMCELAARHLVSNGIGKVLVTNRTFERALGLAEAFKGEAIRFEEMGQSLRRTDIVISSTGSPEYLLRHEQILKVIRDRKQRPIFFIDIAVPRDIDPSINRIENVYLYDLDDLQQVVNANIEDREKEALKAEEIIQSEVAKFIQWYQSLEVMPTLKALRETFERIRMSELEKAFSLHPGLSEKEKQSLDALTSAIVNKILHGPLTHLKTGDESRDRYLDALRVLFGLADHKPEDKG